MYRSVFCRAAVLALTALSFTFVSVHAQTAPPTSINFQGRLATASGNPVPDGTYNLRIRFYDAVTAGNTLFDQSLTNIPVKNGTFAVVISGFTAANFDGNTWIGISINGVADLTPRQQIVSVPYAIKANLALTVADNSITSAKLAANAVTNTDLASDPLSLGKVSDGRLSMDNNQLLYPGGVIKNAAGALNTADLGLYSQVSGRVMRFVTNNALFAWFSDSGIGGTVLMGLTPDGRLSVNGTSANLFSGNSSATGGTFLRLSNSSTGGRTWSLVSSGSGSTEGVGKFLVQDPTGVNRMVMDGAGNVGIGTSTPVDSLTVADAGTAISAIDGAVRTRLFSAASTNTGYVGTFTGNANFSIRTNDTDRILIDSAGRVGVGIPPDVNVRLRVSSGTLNYAIGAEGVVIANSYNTFSDARLKQNIKTVPDALSTLLGLHGVTYYWNPNVPNAIKGQHERQYGFLAQEVEQVLPALVHAGLNGYKAVNYSGILPVAVEAIKAQQSQIAVQSKKIDALAKENAELRAKLDALAEAVRQLQNERK